MQVVSVNVLDEAQQVALAFRKTPDEKYIKTINQPNKIRLETNTNINIYDGSEPRAFSTDTS